MSFYQFIIPEIIPETPPMPTLTSSQEIRTALWYILFPLIPLTLIH